MNDTTPVVGDVWQHKTMPEVVTVIARRWDQVQWVEIECAAGRRHWQEWEWHAWAANARKVK
jgi:hypothetical protein